MYHLPIGGISTPISIGMLVVSGVWSLIMKISTATGHSAIHAVVEALKDKWLKLRKRAKERQR
jgi:hypothetical protein